VLISNNTNEGTIVAYDWKGHFIDYVRDLSGKKIIIDQLWAIDFGGGNANSGDTNALYFTAGPANNLAGTFGVIVPGRK